MARPSAKPMQQSAAKIAAVTRSTRSNWRNFFEAARRCSHHSRTPERSTQTPVPATKNTCHIEGIPWEIPPSDSRDFPRKKSPAPKRNCQLTNPRLIFSPMPFMESTPTCNIMLITAPGRNAHFCFFKRPLCQDILIILHLSCIYFASSLLPYIKYTPLLTRPVLFPFLFSVFSCRKAPPSKNLLSNRTVLAAVLGQNFANFFSFFASSANRTAKHAIYCLFFHFLQRRRLRPPQALFRLFLREILQKIRCRRTDVYVILSSWQTAPLLWPAKAAAFAGTLI